MNRPLLLALVLIVLGICLIGGLASASVLFDENGRACLNKQPGNLIGCLFAGQVTVTVNVRSNVDEAMILREGDDQVMRRFVTNGRDITDTIKLSTLDRYYLVVRKGDQTRTGSPHGLGTSQGSAVEVIFGVDQWEGPF